MPNVTSTPQADQIKATSVQNILNKKNNGYRNGVKTTSGTQNILDKNSFLKILIKQLEHQNPLKPAEDREFIAQMAQFSALEQMKNIANEVKSLKKFQANSFIGKFIVGKDFIHNKKTEGVVSSILFDDTGQVFLRVNGKSIKMEDVISVKVDSQIQKNVSRETLDSNQALKNSNNSNIAQKIAEKNYINNP